MKRWLASGLGFILGWVAPYAAAQAPEWGRSEAVRLGTPVANAPAATLGMPTAAAEPAVPTTTPVAAPIQRVAYQPDRPSPAAIVFRMQAPDPDAPPAFRPPDSDRGDDL